MARGTLRRVSLILLASTLFLSASCTGIRINSIPAGGTVIIDGEATDLRTPTKVRITRLSRGEHTIHVKMAGYETVTPPQRVEVVTSGDTIAGSIVFPLILIVVPFDNQWKKSNPPSEMIPFYLRESGGSSPAPLQRPATVHVYRPNELLGKATIMKATATDATGGAVAAKILKGGDTLSFTTTESMLAVDAGSVASLSLDAGALHNSILPLALESGQSYYIRIRPFKGSVVLMETEEGRRGFEACRE